MASSTTHTRRTGAGSTASGACTNGSTARRSVATRPACGGAATTSTTRDGSEFIGCSEAPDSNPGASWSRTAIALASVGWQAMSERETRIVSEGRAIEDDEPSTGGSREGDYDIGRLMAFSDGVFAVAITLLVFNVPVPAFAQNDAMSVLPNALLHTAPPLLTFALSFFLVGFYWIRHHQLFRQVISADVWLLWLNLIVLFLVCLLPFSSGVFGRYHNSVIGAEIYAVNLAAIAIAFPALYLYATRAHQVRPLPPGMGVGFFSQGLLLPVVVVAMVMVIAPLNLVVAYVTGITLMALVGIYTAAVPQTVRSAPLHGAAKGRLRFPSGAALVTVRARKAMPDLFWARFTGTKPTVRVDGNAVDIESHGFRPVTWRIQSAQIALNASIPWEFRFQEGAWRLT